MGKRITLLGIDGSGKSTLAKQLKTELEKSGKIVKIIPFHKWVFADRIKKIMWKKADRYRNTIDTPYRPVNDLFSSFFKPIIALLDNILFYLLNQPKSENDIIIYDRFICATMIKMNALGYRVNWLRPIWENYKTELIIILTIPEEISIQRQLLRGDPYIYQLHELHIEQKDYYNYGKKHGAIFVNTLNKNPLIQIWDWLHNENII